MTDAKTPTDEKKKTDDNLIDSKFGTMAVDSIVMKKDKNGDDYAEGKLVAGAKEFTVYANGKMADAMKAKAAAGESFLVRGALLARGKAISAQGFEPTVYTGKVTEIGKSGVNFGRPYLAVKIQMEGKDKPWAVLLTGDEDVAKAKLDEAFDGALVWVAGQREDKSWGSSLRSASDVMRVRAPAKEEEPAGPGM